MFRSDSTAHGNVVRRYTPGGGGPSASPMYVQPRKLSTLERAGLVKRTVRGREHLLALKPEPLDEAARWIERHRQFWEQSLANLDAFVQSSPPRKKERKSKP